MHWNPLDELVEECAFSGVVRVRRHGQPMYERGCRVCRSRQLHRQHRRDALWNRFWNEAADGIDRGSSHRRGSAGIDYSSARLRLSGAAGLLSGHHHPASADPHLRDSRLLRRRAHRGFRQFHRRHPLVRAKRSEGLSAGVPTTGDEVCTGGRVLVLQRRLHPARRSGWKR